MSALNRVGSERVASAAPVDVKKVQGRRKLRFDSLDDLLADAESLAASPSTRTLGNWRLGQLLAHLSIAINGSIDGIAFKAPWPVRLIGPLFKNRVLTRGTSPGFKLPVKAESALFPAAETTSEALGDLRKAVGRLRTEKATAVHPVLGRLTHEEWIQLHLRHAEMHLSFAVPE